MRAAGTTLTLGELLLEVSAAAGDVPMSVVLAGQSYAISEAEIVSGKIYLAVSETWEDQEEELDRLREILSDIAEGTMTKARMVEAAKAA